MGSWRCIEILSGWRGLKFFTSKMYQILDKTFFSSYLFFQLNTLKDTQKLLLRLTTLMVPKPWKVKTCTPILFIRSHPPPPPPRENKLSHLTRSLPCEALAARSESLEMISIGLKLTSTYTINLIMRSIKPWLQSSFPEKQKNNLRNTSCYEFRIRILFSLYM